MSASATQGGHKQPIQWLIIQDDPGEPPSTHSRTQLLHNILN